MYSHSRREQKTGREEGNERRRKRERGKSPWMSLIIRALILSDQGTILLTSFNLNYLLISPVHKYSQIQSYSFNTGSLSP